MLRIHLCAQTALHSERVFVVLVHIQKKSNHTISFCLDTRDSLLHDARRYGESPYVHQRAVDSQNPGTSDNIYAPHAKAGLWMKSRKKSGHDGFHVHRAYCWFGMWSVCVWSDARRDSVHALYIPANNQWKVYIFTGVEYGEQLQNTTWFCCCCCF